MVLVGTDLLSDRGHLLAHHEELVVVAEVASLCRLAQASHRFEHGRVLCLVETVPDEGAAAAVDELVVL